MQNTRVNDRHARTPNDQHAGSSEGYIDMGSNGLINVQYTPTAVAPPLGGVPYGSGIVPPLSTDYSNTILDPSGASSCSMQASRADFGPNIATFGPNVANPQLANATMGPSIPGPF